MTAEVAVDAATIRLPIKNLLVAIKVPKGPESQEVRVVVEDRLGSNEVYKQRLKPGDEFDLQVKMEGDAIVKIYFDGQLVRMDEVPYAQ